MPCRAAADHRRTGDKAMPMGVTGTCTGRYLFMDGTPNRVHLEWRCSLSKLLLGIEEAFYGINSG